MMQEEATSPETETLPQNEFVRGRRVARLDRLGLRGEVEELLGAGNGVRDVLTMIYERHPEAADGDDRVTYQNIVDALRKAEKRANRADNYYLMRRRTLELVNQEIRDTTEDICDSVKRINKAIKDRYTSDDLSKLEPRHLQMLSQINKNNVDALRGINTILCELGESRRMEDNQIARKKMIAMKAACEKNGVDFGKFLGDLAEESERA